MRISKAVRENWAEVLEKAVPPTVVTTDGNWTVPLEYGFVRLIYKQEGLPEDYELVVGGYASPQVIDREKHLITKEAMAADLPRFLAHPKFRNAMIVHSNIQVGEVLPKWCHPDTGECYETKVDDIGLFCLIKIRTDKYRPEICEKVEADVRAGRLAAFSISGDAPFDSRRHVCHDGTCFWIIDKIIFYEITVCQLGVNQDAKFSILSKMAHCAGGACPIDLPASLTGASLLGAQASHVHKQGSQTGAPKEPAAPAGPTRPDPSHADVGQRAGSATGTGSIPTGELETKQEGEAREGDSGEPHLECERKFEVDKGALPELPQPWVLVQGYWGEDDSLRLIPARRRAYRRDKEPGTRALCRMKTSERVDYGEALRTIASAPHVAVKERYLLRDEIGRAWLIDHMLTGGKGSWSAETEFADADAAQALELTPTWCGRDVTAELEAYTVAHAEPMEPGKVRAWVEQAARVGSRASYEPAEVEERDEAFEWAPKQVPLRKGEGDVKVKIKGSPEDVREVLDKTPADGIGQEMREHPWAGRETAERIVQDHLREDPAYYDEDKSDADYPAHLREDKQQFAPGGDMGGGESPGDVAGGWASQVHDPTDIRHPGGGGIVEPERKCAHGVLYRGDQTFGPPEMEYGEPDEEEEKEAPEEGPKEEKLAAPTVGYPRLPRPASLQRPKPIRPAGTLVRAYSEHDDPAGLGQEYPDPDGVLGEQGREWLQHDEGEGWQAAGKVRDDAAGGEESEAYYLNKEGTDEGELGFFNGQADVRRPSGMGGRDGGSGGFGRRYTAEKAQSYGDRREHGRRGDLRASEVRRGRASALAFGVDEQTMLDMASDEASVSQRFGQADSTLDVGQGRPSGYGDLSKACPLCATQAAVEAALDSRDLYSVMTPQFRGVLRHCLASLQAGVGSVDWAPGMGWVVLSVDHAGSGFMKSGYAVPLGMVMEAVGASAFERGLVDVVRAAVDAGGLLAAVHPLSAGEANGRLADIVARLDKAGLAGMAADAISDGFGDLVKQFPSLGDIATWAWTGNPALLKGFRVGWLGDAGRILRQVTDRLGKLSQKELPDHVRVGIASLLEDLHHLEDSLGVTEELKGQVVGVEEPELNVVREVAKETERDVEDADNKLTAVDPDIEKERTTERFERDNEEDTVHPANVNVMTGPPPGVPTGNPDAVESYRTKDSAISRARDTTFGNVITGRLHQAYSDAADRAFSLGYFKDSEERKKVGKAIGDALKVFEDGLREAGLHDIPVSAEDAARLTKAVRNWPHVEKQTGPDSDLWGGQNRGAGRRALGPTTEELDTVSQGQHPAYGFSRHLRGEPEMGKAVDVDVAVNRGVATTGSDRDPDALVDYSSGPHEPRWPDGDDAGEVHKHEDKEGTTQHHRKLIRRGTKPPRPNMKPCPRCRRNWIHRDMEVCADCYREVGPGERPHDVQKDTPAQWAQDRAVDPSRISNDPATDEPMRVSGAGVGRNGYFEDQGPADAEHPQPIREREFDSRGAIRDEKHSVPIVKAPILKSGAEDVKALFKLYASMWARTMTDKRYALAVLELDDDDEPLEFIDITKRRRNA